MACWNMVLSWLVLAMVVASHGLPLDRAEKAELEHTLDKMNALLDQLAKSLDEDSQPAPHHPNTPVIRPSQIGEEPEPDEPSTEGDGFENDLGEQERRSWDDGPEPEAMSYLEPRSEEDDNSSLRAALRYLMQLEKARQAHKPSVKRDHDIPFPFMDNGYQSRWGNQ